MELLLEQISSKVPTYKNILLAFWYIVTVRSCDLTVLG